MTQLPRDLRSEVLSRRTTLTFSFIWSSVYSTCETLSRSFFQLSMERTFNLSRGSVLYQCMRCGRAVHWIYSFCASGHNWWAPANILTPRNTRKCSEHWSYTSSSCSFKWAVMELWGLQYVQLRCSLLRNHSRRTWGWRRLHGLNILHLCHSYGFRSYLNQSTLPPCINKLICLGASEGCHIRNCTNSAAVF